MRFIGYISMMYIFQSGKKPSRHLTDVTFTRLRRKHVAMRFALRDHIGYQIDRSNQLVQNCIQNHQSPSFHCESTSSGVMWPRNSMMVSDWSLVFNVMAWGKYWVGCRRYEKAVTPLGSSVLTEVFITRLHAKTQDL